MNLIIKPSHFLSITAVLAVSLESYAGSSSWQNTVSMNQGRLNHVSVLLQDGRVLVAGGSVQSYLVRATETAEIFDPQTGEWTFTSSMQIARGLVASVTLCDGRIMVIGSNARSEIFDAQTETWMLTSPMHSAATSAQGATLLPDCRVLVTGGQSSIVVGMSTAELYDPAADEWTNVNDMLYRRGWHSAVTLNDGKVLVSGGYYRDGEDLLFLPTAEVFDPNTGSWAEVGRMQTPRGSNKAIILTNGQIVVTGGYLTRLTDVYDPAKEVWRSGSEMTSVRTNHSATHLDDDSVLLAGGFVGVAEITASAEILGSPVVTEMNQVRAFHGATRLLDGRVLISGGEQEVFEVSPALASAEIYTPIGASQL